MPHDVIVMMPDVEAYAPCIESVFSHVPGQGGPPIPFSLSDRRKRIESGVLEAFLNILAMNDARLERSRVLELLQSGPIALKFGIVGNQVEMIETAIRTANIFWGRDGNHRQELTGTGFEEKHLDVRSGQAVFRDSTARSGLYDGQGQAPAVF